MDMKLHAVQLLPMGNNAKHAVIRVFVVDNDYQQSKQVLAGHNLTISSLKFSPDGKYLLAVSRDRQFSLWELIDETEFKLVELNAKAHSRIIWDCSWLNGTSFVTVSRDKQMKLWKVEDKVTLVNSLKLEEPITAVSVFKGKTDASLSIIALGLESGQISVYTTDGNDFKLIVSFDEKITPADRIEKVSFSNQVVDKKLLLGVGSKDMSVRVYTMEETLFR